MTTALAAALRELDRSSASLEQELSQNTDFLALVRIEGRAVPRSMESERHRLELIGRLAAIPAFRAWRAIWSVRQHMVAPPARPVDAQETDAPSPSAIRPDAPMAEAPQGAAIFARPAGAPQALTAIRGIDASLAGKLRALGIDRYEQIAAWRAADVRAVRTALGLGREISRRNWIEQAALLAQRTAGAIATKPAGPTAALGQATLRPPVANDPAASTGGQPDRALPVAGSSPRQAPMSTSPASPTAPISAIDMQRSVMLAARAASAGAAAQIARCRPLEIVTPVVSILSADVPVPRAQRPPIARVKAARPAAPLPKASSLEETPQAPSPVDSFARIAGIDADMARALPRVGVARFATMAAWTTADVRAIAARLGIRAARINREGWIEQAAILALGHDTAYSRRVMAGELASLCPAPTPPPALSASAPPSRLTRRPEIKEELAGGPSGVREPDEAAVATSASGAGPHARRLRLARTLSHRIEEKIEDIAEDVVESPVPDDSVAAFIDVPAEEATVTIVAAAPSVAAIEAYDTATKPYRSGSPVRDEARPSTPTAGRIGRRYATLPSTEIPAGPSLPGGEEAVVEIIRRDGPVAPAGVAALTAPADYRPSQTFAEPRREPRREPHQPVWIADQSGDAGGVLRRFLKALKRDG